MTGPAELVGCGGVEVPQLGRVGGVRIVTTAAAKLSLRFHWIRPPSRWVAITRGTPRNNVPSRRFFRMTGCAEIPRRLLKPKFVVAGMRVMADSAHPRRRRPVLILAGKKIVL